MCKTLFNQSVLNKKLSFIRLIIQFLASQVENAHIVSKQHSNMLDDKPLTIIRIARFYILFFININQCAIFVRKCAMLPHNFVVCVKSGFIQIQLIIIK
jgi:hypothetical protein